MESEKHMLSRHVPRNLSLSRSNKSIPGGPLKKLGLTVLEKFRALVRQREREVGIFRDDDEASSPLTTDEVVQLYEIVLAELMFNSKPIITDLTIVAGEQREHGKGIADAICDRIIEAPVDQKFPSLYLLDSIVKNIGREYVRYFSSRLAEVFCETFRQIHSDMYPSLRHLFDTWSTVFPPFVLHKVENQLQFCKDKKNQSSGLSSSRDPESPRLSHGIHVNPKYLRQLEHSPTQNKEKHARVTSYDEQQGIGYEEFDADHAEIMSLQAGNQRLNPMGTAGQPSAVLGANKLHPSRTSRPLSPSRTGAERHVFKDGSDYSRENSSPRIIDDGSTSESIFNYGAGKQVTRDEAPSGRRERSNSHNQPEAADACVNGDDYRRPRALIDAYGHDREKRVPDVRHPPADPLDANEVGDKLAPLSWHNAEEEEFDWEDMSPTTLADHHRSSNFFAPSVSSFGSGGVKCDPGRANHSQLEFDVRRNQPTQVHLQSADHLSNISEHTAHFPGTGVRSASIAPGIQAKRAAKGGSSYSQEAWNSPRQFSQPVHPLAKGRERDIQSSFSESSKYSSSGSKLTFVDKHPDVQFDLPSSSSRLGSGINFSSLGMQSGGSPLSTKVRPPPAHVIKSLPPHFILSETKQGRSSSFDSISSSFPPINHGFEPNDLRLIKRPLFHGQLGPISHQAQAQAQAQAQFENFRSQFLPSFESQDFPPHPLVSVPPRPLPLQPKGLLPANQFQVAHLPVPMSNIPMAAPSPVMVQLPMLPYLPHTSQMISMIPQNAGPVVSNLQLGNAFSSVISSLLPDGLLLETNEAQMKESSDLHFGMDLLKLHNDFAIKALYTDLPRQCTTCGMRFKTQEMHSSHMDWHVTKNRMSKNRKQSSSRKWFVGVSMWLSGAETLGAEAVPSFLPADAAAEKKGVSEEMSVPADEDQRACALCGELFDDFYSDEMEEWMYRDAVYMNACDASMAAGMDLHQLGPIVHVKCKPEGCLTDERENAEEGSSRKRLRL